MPNVVIYVIFALTYVLIASRRLSLLPIGRPAGALTGSVLMVAVGALSPEEAFQAVDHQTIVVLFAMMAICAYLEEDGFFRVLSDAVRRRVRSPWTFLWMLSAASAFLSACLLNDTVCLFLTPFVVAFCRDHRLPYGPYLIALATSANIGSAATIVGNPQNMIIAAMSGLSFTRFASTALAPAIAGTIANIAMLRLYYHRRLPPTIEPAFPSPDSPPFRPFSLIVTVAVLAAFTAGANLATASMFGLATLILVRHEDPQRVFARVNWTVLIFFCGLFVIVAGLRSTGVVERVWSAAAPIMPLTTSLGTATFSAAMTVASNLVSNVPLVLLVGPHLPGLGGGETAWVLTAFVVTVAGNLTLIGSVANIIVVEGAREHYALGFREYLRFGAVSTVVVTAIGVTILRLTT